jgi:hypothetical protein
LGSDDLEGLLTTDNSKVDGFRLEGYEAPKPWHTLMEEADNHYLGLQGYIQDYAESFKLYRNAARLGCPEAYERLGNMYKSGERVREDAQKALDFFKEGAKKGNYFCYGSMTELFIRHNHVQNAQKAFVKFPIFEEVLLYRPC